MGIILLNHSHEVLSLRKIPLFRVLFGRFLARNSNLAMTTTGRRLIMARLLGSSDTAAMLVLLACSNLSKRSHTDCVRVSRHSALCLRFAKLRSTISCKNAKYDNSAHRDREGKRTGRNETPRCGMRAHSISELSSEPVQAPTT